MSTTNSTNPTMTRRQRRITEGRRLFRVLTEEERAARFDRIMRLLDFLFKVIPALNATGAVAATMLADEAADEAYAAITHAIGADPVEA